MRATTNLGIASASSGGEVMRVENSCDAIGDFSAANHRWLNRISKVFGETANHSEVDNRQPIPNFGRLIIKNDLKNKILKSAKDIGSLSLMDFAMKPSLATRMEESEKK